MSDRDQSPASPVRFSLPNGTLFRGLDHARTCIADRVVDQQAGHPVRVHLSPLANVDTLTATGDLPCETAKPVPRLGFRPGEEKGSCPLRRRRCRGFDEAGVRGRPDRPSKGRRMALARAGWRIRGPVIEVAARTWPNRAAHVARIQRWRSGASSEPAAQADGRHVSGGGTPHDPVTGRPAAG